MTQKPRRNPAPLAPPAPAPEPPPADPAPGLGVTMPTVPVPDPMPPVPPPPPAPPGEPGDLDATVPPAAGPLSAPPVAVPRPPDVPEEVRNAPNAVILKPRPAAGYVNAAGEPLDLATVFQKVLATGNTVRVTETVLEEYDLPGTTVRGQTLKWTVGTILAKDKADALIAEQKARAVASAAVVELPGT